ncbi:aldo/keto reductase [Streptomyces flaveolus]|uniref:aldo/keto reductase n=1 Tax=Streptomyces flaveolus TaxID=67297 RepID=UPI0033B17A21
MTTTRRRAPAAACSSAGASTSGPWESGATVAAVALAWVRRQPLTKATVIGARTVAQLDANLASLDVTLSAEHLAELDGLTAPAPRFPLSFLKALGAPAQQGTTVIDGVKAGG